jgi:HAD superfamily hydrolase (TIGR01484 family)
MREKRKISLVIADVDGTLVTKQKILTKRAQAAVQALRRGGIGFAITSGRPPRGMAMLIEPLALATPIAGFNGGIFVKPDMTIVEEHLLAPDTARRAVEFIRHRLRTGAAAGSENRRRERRSQPRRALREGCSGYTRC